jgi:epoxyqueuosine reductase
LNRDELLNAFEDRFDLVGLISSDRYFSVSKDKGLKLKKHDFPSIIVLGLSYPKRLMKSDQEKAYASFYTFGQDYHTVMQNRIHEVMKNFNCQYSANVDNHPYDERLAAEIAGLGFKGKNQLVINSEYGSYLFLGMVFIDVVFQNEVILNIDNGCGDCSICIDACPTKALSEQGYEIEKCISAFNQTKKSFSAEEIKVNYCLFGCDICQMVCPKNVSIKSKVHPEFQLSGKEGVRFFDLFTSSEKEFRAKYNDMAYLWKGKTILMRNGLTILRRQKNSHYNDLIESSLKTNKASWYQETAKIVLQDLKK